MTPFLHEVLISCKTNFAACITSASNETVLPAACVCELLGLHLVRETQAAACRQDSLEPSMGQKELHTLHQPHFCYIMSWPSVFLICFSPPTPPLWIQLVEEIWRSIRSIIVFLFSFSKFYFHFPTLMCPVWKRTVFLRNVFRGAGRISCYPAHWIFTDEENSSTNPSPFFHWDRSSLNGIDPRGETSLLPGISLYK